MQDCILTTASFWPTRTHQSKVLLAFERTCGYLQARLGLDSNGIRRCQPLRARRIPIHMQTASRTCSKLVRDNCKRASHPTTLLHR
jgi:hypothetical protein